MNDIDFSAIDSLADSLADSEIKEGELIIQAPVLDIIPDPNQPRKDRNINEDAELKRSVEQFGVLQPIVIRPLNDDGKYMIVFGERRFDAAIASKLLKIPAVIRDISNTDVLVVQTIENIQRADMSMVDEINAVAKISIELGVKKAAEKLGKPTQYVSKRNSLFKASSYLKAFIDKKYSRDFNAFYELAGLDKKEPDKVKEIINLWESTPSSRESLRGQIEEAKILSTNKKDVNTKKVKKNITPVSNLSEDVYPNKWKSITISLPPNLIEKIKSMQKLEMEKIRKL